MNMTLSLWRFSMLIQIQLGFKPQRVGEAKSSTGESGQADIEQIMLDRQIEEERRRNLVNASVDKTWFF